MAAAALALTLGLAWSWMPRPSEPETASVSPIEARIPPPAEPVELAEPAEPIELAEPAEPVELTEPAGFAEPVEKAPALPARLVSIPPPAVLPAAPPIAVASEIQPTAEEPLRREREAFTPSPVANQRPTSRSMLPQVATPGPRLAPPPQVAKPKPQPAPSQVAKPTPQVANVSRPPSVHVSRTVWHPNPDRRSALVEIEGFSEPLELREGDAVGVLVVAEIQPSAVIFLHGGNRLRRAVGK